MAARVPRRSFASPFVITLAVAPACTPAPGPSNTPTETTADPTVAATPTTAPTPDGPDTTTPEPTTTEQPEARWSVSKQGKDCFTQRHAECPTPAPGEPMRSCNPPAPLKYECPKWDDGSPMGFDAGDHIEGVAGGKQCTLYFSGGECPEGASCNPPPPRAVPCPKV